MAKPRYTDISNGLIAWPNNPNVHTIFSILDPPCTAAEKKDVGLPISPCNSKHTPFYDEKLSLEWRWAYYMW